MTSYKTIAAVIVGMSMIPLRVLAGPPATLPDGSAVSMDWEVRILGEYAKRDAPLSKADVLSMRDKLLAEAGDAAVAYLHQPPTRPLFTYNKESPIEAVVIGYVDADRLDEAMTFAKGSGFGSSMLDDIASEEAICGRLEKAITAANAVSGDDHWLVYGAIVDSLVHKGDLLKAEEISDKIESDEWRARSYISVAEARIKLGDVSTAAKLLGLAHGIAIAKNDAELLGDIAHANASSGGQGGPKATATKELPDKSTGDAARSKWTLDSDDIKLCQHAFDKAKTGDVAGAKADADAIYLSRWHDAIDTRDSKRSDELGAKATELATWIYRSIAEAQFRAGDVSGANDTLLICPRQVTYLYLGNKKVRCNSDTVFDLIGVGDLDNAKFVAERLPSNSLNAINDECLCSIAIAEADLKLDKRAQARVDLYEALSEAKDIYRNPFLDGINAFLKRPPQKSWSPWISNANIAHDEGRDTWDAWAQQDARYLEIAPLAAKLGAIACAKEMVDEHERVVHNWYSPFTPSDSPSGHYLVAEAMARAGYASKVEAWANGASSIPETQISILLGAASGLGTEDPSHEVPARLAHDIPATRPNQADEDPVPPEVPMETKSESK